MSLMNSRYENEFICAGHSLLSMRTEQQVGLIQEYDYEDEVNLSSVVAVHLPENFTHLGYLSGDGSLDDFHKDSKILKLFLQGMQKKKKSNETKPSGLMLKDGESSTASSNFVGERVEEKVKSGLVQPVLFPKQAQWYQQPENSLSQQGVRKFDPVTTSAAIESIKVHPSKDTNPLPRWYNSRCEFHSGGVGHDTDNCYNLKHRVQDLIDQKLLIFPGTSLIQNPLPIHEVGSSFRKACRQHDVLSSMQLEERSESAYL
ncbi:UNVERIFIED_CONTAM: hypothetical protein Scaly_2959200 [Sesamum calycinum]|uniref:Uncharacterized protein n=1 Tax=Sesamum calycinum TaxID=2727403 RepID=A0AAW2KA04_9LAMI